MTIDLIIFLKVNLKKTLGCNAKLKWTICNNVFLVLTFGWWVWGSQPSTQDFNV